MPTVAEPFGVVRDRAVYLPDPDVLVVADLHLGKIATSGVEVPLDEGAAVVDRLAALLGSFEPAEVVLAGDVLHAFGAVPTEAKRSLAAITALVDDAGAGFVVLAGNHDTHLATLVDEPPAMAHELVDGTVVCHGHERPAIAGRRYVVGHDHPVIEIDGRRRPCFLQGPVGGAPGEVLALPAFNPAVRGTAVNSLDDGDALSPFLAEVSRFHPLVWDAAETEALVFPALGALQPYL